MLAAAAGGNRPDTGGGQDPGYVQVAVLKSEADTDLRIAVNTVWVVQSP